MPVDFIPSVLAAVALVAAGCLPALVLALSHGPFRIEAPGRRFACAALCTWAAWIAVAIALAPGWVDLVTGTLLLATATVVCFTLWTLIAWGFTLSMLLALDRAGRPLSIDDWECAYTRGKPLDVLTRDRLGILFALGLAELRGASVVMTPSRGRLFARTAAALRKLFGLSR